MTVVQILRIWLASIILSNFTPERMHPNNEELQQAHIEYVNEVVKDIQIIIYDPLYTPWFGGKWGRAQDAALVAIISSEESGGYRPKVVTGKKRGDNGSSWCMMSLNIGKGKTPQGWTGSELITDRHKCLLVGIHAMHQSMNACRRYGTLSGLSIYNTGRCIQGERISVFRISRALYKVNKNVPTDNEVMKEYPFN